MAGSPSSVPSNAPKWGVIDFLRWKLIPERAGGGWAYIRAFKDGWVKHNRATIKTAASANRIPPELLAATAWIEVAGDPTFVDRLAFEVRTFDWSGPDWIDKHLTITKEPSKTSFGPVSMQLRTAAETMGLDSSRLSGEQLRDLANRLQSDVNNLNLAAKHLHNLIKHDFPTANTAALTQEQIKIAGARYNRGGGLKLDAIKKNTSYGDVVLKLWPRMTKLLSG